MKVAQKVVGVWSLGSEKISQALRKYKKREGQVDVDGGKGGGRGVRGLELMSLMMALGHSLGVVTLSNKTRFLMLLFNLVMLVGHVQEMKRHLRGNLSRL